MKRFVHYMLNPIWQRFSWGNRFENLKKLFITILTSKATLSYSKIHWAEKFFRVSMQIFLCKRSIKCSSKCHLLTKSHRNCKKFLAPCLQPLDLRVSLKLCEQNVSCYFTWISIMKGSHLCWNLFSWTVLPVLVR